MPPSKLLDQEGRDNGVGKEIAMIGSSSGRQQALCPSRTIVTSFTPRKKVSDGGNADANSYFEEGDWVLCLASPNDRFATSQNGGPSIACALSNGEIQVYDQKTLHPIATFHSSKEGQSSFSSSSTTQVTDLIYGPSQDHSTTLVATRDDGSVSMYDIRQPHQASLCTRLPMGQAALNASLGYDGYLAAVASSKARIHFLDLRKMSHVTNGNNHHQATTNEGILGSYVDSHTDLVNCVEFHPTIPSLLVSGAEDGLVCVFDTTQPTEDTALQSILSVGTPLRKVGFAGDGEASKVWCLTGSETASLWDIASASPVVDFGPQLRETLSQSLGNNNKPIDYLIDAHWNASSQELLLSAGNAAGDAALFRLTSQTLPMSYPNPQQWTSLEHSKRQFIWEPCHWMTGGHRGVVRAVCHLSQSMILSAGEDARLCEWNRMGNQTHAASHISLTTSLVSPRTAKKKNSVPHLGGPRTTTNLAGRGGGPLRRQRQRPFAAPY